MSYRDLRNFTEMMKTLGFPRLISMENFRNPNFPLVAEILIWLVKRFESNTSIPLEFETEEQRVYLIRTAAQFMATKAHIKLNTKRLYQADGYAVKELLKVSSVLYGAFGSSGFDEEDDEDGSNYIPIDISAKIEDIKRARQLASEITTKGAALYDLLGKEVDLREQRSVGLARPVELGKAEVAVKSAIEGAKNELTETRTQIEGVASSESSLDSKIEKRKTELERTHKRLQSLKKVRPAFMEEFERLEQELRGLFEDYVVRHRCLSALEQIHHQAEQIEEQRAQDRLVATRKMLEAIQKEEGSLKFLESSSIDGTGFFSNDERNGQKSPLGEGLGVVATGASAAGVAAGRRVFGSMTGAGLEDEEESASLLGSDSDLLLGAGQDSELGTDDDEDDDDDLPLGDKIGINPSTSGQGGKPQELSDDDF